MNHRFLLAVLAVFILMPPKRYEPAQNFYAAGHSINDSRDEFGIKAD